jgi:hypothetical protein
VKNINFLLMKRLKKKQLNGVYKGVIEQVDQHGNLLLIMRLRIIKK